MRPVILVSILLLGLLAVQLNLFVVTGIYRGPTGAWTYRGVRCDVDYYPTKGVVALYCPGVDVIRVWPLPVVQPWDEEGE